MTRTSPREDDARRDAAHAEHMRRQKMLDALHYSVFSTPDGQKMLAYFRQITIERRNPAGDSDGALRELEAARNFVADIERAIARHRAISTG